MTSPIDEHDLRRHLDEAHRQLLERDRVYRFHEEQLEAGTGRSWASERSSRRPRPGRSSSRRQSMSSRPLERGASPTG